MTGTVFLLSLGLVQASCPVFNEEVCGGRGHCHNNRCWCRPSWLGLACQISSRLDCSLEPCNCTKGWFGTTCDQECPGGSQSPCNHHGVCNDGRTGNGTCVCFSRWNGDACEYLMDETPTFSTFPPAPGPSYPVSTAQERERNAFICLGLSIVGMLNAVVMSWLTRRRFKKLSEDCHSHCQLESLSVGYLLLAPASWSLLLSWRLSLWILGEVPFVTLSYGVPWLMMLVAQFAFLLHLDQVPTLPTGLPYLANPRLVGVIGAFQLATLVGFLPLGLLAAPWLPAVAHISSLSCAAAQTARLICFVLLSSRSPAELPVSHSYTALLLGNTFVVALLFTFRLIADTNLLHPSDTDPILLLFHIIHSVILPSIFVQQPSVSPPNLV
eukprot:CAMPEP_0184679428 /NCGR_PEP_ID=MMETSP0312-20130426/2259_1 /TAXON_ID=31354 /ORGANISM="Compsopogon coeruleus, Strain SAG 36.94" /LENGTH=382 /DNA_ID=CAMNT_0027128859 /DNA_START=288 /DNA_END=1439 /DNA_ORIENTATION=-